MLRMTWRNIFARKVRLALSAFAIVLGVAFVAGSFIFTDAMGDAFDGIIEGSTADVEVAFQGANDFDSAQDARVIPASVVRRLEGLPEVGSVHPTDQLQSVYVIGRSGKVVGGNGPPGLAFNYTATRSVSGRPIIRLVSGAIPDAARQVALDVDTARKAGYGVGDTVKLVTPGDPPTLSVEVVGLVDFGSGGLNGASLTVFERRYMQQEFFGGRDVYSIGGAEHRPGGEPGPAARRRPEGAARGRRGPHRRLAGEDQQGRAGPGPGLPQHVPAGVRGRVPGRRHLPHHQHLLDPRRAAQQGAGPAARAGRLPSTGQRLGAGRGHLRRAGRLHAGDRRRLPARPGPAGAVRCDRLRPQPGLVPRQPAHGRGVVRRRAGGHAARGVPAGAAGLAGAAGGGAARRRRPAGVVAATAAWSSGSCSSRRDRGSMVLGFGAAATSG